MMTREGSPRARGGVRVWVALLAAFLVLAGVLSYASLQVSAHNMPQVRVTQPYARRIRQVDTAMGVLRYPDVQEVFLPEGCLVESVLARRGSNVDAGQPLMRLSLDDLDALLLAQRADNEAIRRARSASTGTAERALLNKRLEKGSGRAESLQALIDAGGMLVSATRGQVADIYVDGWQRVGDTGRALSICRVPDRGIVEWDLGPQDRAYSTASAVFLTLDGESRRLSFHPSAHWFEPSVQRVRYTAQLEEELSWQMYYGQPLPMELTYLSEEYPYVIPSEAIHASEQGGSYVYCVRTRERTYGAESYVVKTTVHVVERNADFASISEGVQEPIVESASKALREGDAVRVIGE